MNSSCSRVWIRANKWFGWKPFSKQSEHRSRSLQNKHLYLRPLSGVILQPSHCTPDTKSLKCPVGLEWNPERKRNIWTSKWKLLTACLHLIHTWWRKNGLIKSGKGNEVVILWGLGYPCKNMGKVELVFHAGLTQVVIRTLQTFVQNPDHRLPPTAVTTHRRKPDAGFYFRFAAL